MRTALATGLLAFATVALAQMGDSMSSEQSEEMKKMASFEAKVPMGKIAHAVVASLAWGIFFPFSAISIVTIKGKWALRLHVISQIIGCVLFVTGFGLGVWLARGLKVIDKYHAIIGIVLFALLGFQLVLGVVHHWMFPAIQRRTFWTYSHLWLGRAAITLGMINIGLGLMFGKELYPKDAAKDKKGWIAVSVVVPIIWVVWVGTAVWNEVVKAKEEKAQRADPQRASTSEMSSEAETEHETVEKKV